ncbi:MAG: flavin reductase family protein [Alcaligenaceae bacterium]|jgi:flavin reductase (DIM6/NTAB) family NADH-FMN oxidoreductase RutF|nr:flavin reductase family protein [Alcaligenaceae bacterium]
MSNKHQTNFTEKDFRQALGRFATGVAIVTATDLTTGKPVGLTVSSFNSVSLDPPLVLWCLRLASQNLDLFKNTSHYNIHILANDQIDLAMQFSTAKVPDRFEGIDWELNKAGTPLLSTKYCSAIFECANEQQHPAGDHLIMVGYVENCQHTNKLPLVFHAGTFDLTPTSRFAK